jgi:hypothetical protein
MSDRYDVMTGRTYTDRDGNQKTAWTRIGTMFATERGFAISFDALPLPQLRDGKLEVRAVCFPPKEKEEPQQRGGRNTSVREDLSDSIPF